MSTAEWTGVPLADVLDRAGPAPGACKVIFRGADAGSPGSPERSPEPVRFERSLGSQSGDQRQLRRTQPWLTHACSC